MIAAAADTHAALWYLLKHPSLSDMARRFIDEAAVDGQSIVLSSISLAEIVYLTEKGRLAASVDEELRKALGNPDFVLEEVAFDGEIVEAMRQVSRDEIPDMPDRIIAATAVYFGVPVLSRDSRVRASSVRTIW